MENEWVPLIARWIHFLAGITWIGLLYYFNLVQAPAMAAANADHSGPGGAGIAKYVLPRALFWFRWAALVTWIAGAALLGPSFVSAFTLQGYDVIIGIGSWLGTIMLLFVWGVIWPNQKKVLGLKPATDAEKATARRVAFLTSRVNTALSIPMLLFMGASAHGMALFG